MTQVCGQGGNGAMSEREQNSDIRTCNDLRANVIIARATDQKDLSTRHALLAESRFAILIKAAIARDLRECRFSRDEVAEGLGRLAGHEITVAQIDAWAAESKHQHRFPAELVAAWVRVTGSRRMLDLICAEVGGWFADDMMYDLAEYGRAAVQAEKTKARVWDRL